MPFKHGYAIRGNLHPCWRTLRKMKMRCYNPNADCYKNYGGRGITICQEWLDDPAAFVRWSLQNGWAPGLTIERKDNDGNYTPENCVWATRTQQGRNSRNCKLTEADVKHIREAVAGGMMQRSLAIAFGVHEAHIWNIVHNKTWKGI